MNPLSMTNVVGGHFPADMASGDAGDSLKVGAQTTVSRPASLATTSLRQFPRTSSNAGLLMGLAGGSSIGPKEGASSGGLGGRSYSVMHGGLLAPGQMNGTTADVVTAVKDLQLRKRSIMFQQAASQTGPSLQTRTGCLSTYFFAPNPTPGKVRWPHVKLAQGKDASLVRWPTHLTSCSGMDLSRHEFGLGGS